jgi:hypothetical protein
MNKSCCIFAIAVILLPASWRASAQQHPSMPPGMTHQDHLAQLQREADTNKRGADAMGFDQDRVTHHFLLTPSGGTIRVEAKDASDTATRDAIRTHLRGIAAAFAHGDFGAPFATHAEMPPGAATMQTVKATLSYVFDERPGGGDVRIVTADEQALAAVHDFLRYQIREHHTGDPLAIK